VKSQGSQEGLRRTLGDKPLGIFVDLFEEGAQFGAEDLLGHEAVMLFGSKREAAGKVREFFRRGERKFV